METFSALLAICAGNSPVPGEFPAQRAVTRSFDVFFDLRLNKRLSKQWWGWWFETVSCPLWRHRNVIEARKRMQASLNRAVMSYGNGLSHGRGQAIICTSAAQLWIEQIWTDIMWIYRLQIGSHCGQTLIIKFYVQNNPGALVVNTRKQWEYYKFRVFCNNLLYIHFALLSGNGNSQNGMIQNEHAINELVCNPVWL